MSGFGRDGNGRGFRQGSGRQPEAESEGVDHPLRMLHEDPRVALALYRKLKIQRKARAEAERSRAASKIPASGGAPLPAETRKRMEGQLGADLSSVAVHTGAESAKAADELGARAMTVGADVHFAAGEFAPGTKEGDRLLAHELAHVVQGQRSGVQRKADETETAGEHAEPEVSQPHEPAEKEADQVADQVASNLHRDDGERGDKKAGDGAKEATTQAAPPLAAKLDAGKVHLAGKDQLGGSQAQPGTGTDEKKTDDKKVDGAAETVDLFVRGNAPKEQGPARWKYIENPEVWAPERRALHEQLLKEAKQQAQTFADAAQGGEPTLHAMRGNTAAGKSRAMKQNPALAGPMKLAPGAAVNPDNFKPRLMSEGGFTSTQVHSESSMLSTRLENELLGMETSDGGEVATMLVDKRLATVEDVMHYAELARISGRRLSLHDVDAPLEVSLAGVLERQPGGNDPLPPFDVVKRGFEAVRTNRQAVVDLFVGNPEFGDYELYATMPTGDRIKIAEVTGGELKILDPTLYAEVTAPPGAAGEMVAQKAITEQAIAELTAKLPGDRAKTVAAVLQKYVGRTWKAALDDHSREKAEKKQ